MDKLLSMVGLARRAGKISSGSVGCEQSVKGKAAKLVIIATDASDNTKKAFTNTCSYYDTECIEYADMQSLGQCIGADERAVVSVNDKNFAKAISDIYKANHTVNVGKGDE